MGARPKNPEQLNDQQERFCQEYLKDLSVTKAAERADYSKDTAAQQGSRLMAMPKVQRRIEALMVARSKRTAITQDRVLKELMHLATLDVGEAFDDMGQLLPLTKMPKRVRRAIGALEVHEIFDGQGEQKSVIGLAKKVRFWEKPKALELLGKHLKLFTEKHEHSGPDGKPIEVKSRAEISDAELEARIRTLLQGDDGGPESPESGTEH